MNQDYFLLFFSLPPKSETCRGNYTIAEYCRIVYAIPTSTIVYMYTPLVRVGEVRNVMKRKFVVAAAAAAF